MRESTLKLLSLVYSLQPVGQCALRFSVGNEEFLCETVVFPRSGHDLNFWWDFLNINVLHFDGIVVYRRV